MELIKIGVRTYYIKNVTNIGIYKIDNENVYLIDTGNDKEAGKKILNIVEEQGWKVKGIINTHSHADHIGGNSLIQTKTNCPVLAYHAEKGFIEHPILESSFLYGGFPLEELRNKFLLAKKSVALEMEQNLPNGLELILLPGHSFDMVGIKTSDDVYFLGDALINEKTISKYHLFFLYDVEQFLNTLDYLSTLRGKFYVPSHGEGTENILPLISKNREKIQEVIEVVFESVRDGRTFEEILKYIFNRYSLVMNINQFVLIGSVLKSYLSYLYSQKRIHYWFHGNQMLWGQGQTFEG